MRLIQSAVFKLTLWYLGIIMVLSLLFSLALYQVSYDQLAATANRQRTAIERLPLPLSFEARRTDYIQALYDQLDASQHRLVFRLTLLNLATLVLGGGAAYFFARRTLHPVQEAMEAQGRFTADASHELRTPLTAMRTEIEVALRDKTLTAKDARELLSSNLEEIAKLEALSAGLLRLARIENGLEPSAITATPVAQLFEAAIDRYQRPIADRHLQIEAHHGPESIAGDRASLIELVAILLDNAIKYSSAKSTITLASQPTAGLVTLSVTDQGVGIAAADLPHIFDRFYRADPSRTKGQATPASPGGYGLGLSIAKRIVDLHHGTITVDSAPEKGATFRVKLPIQYALPRNASF